MVVIFIRLLYTWKNYIKCKRDLVSDLETGHGRDLEGLPRQLPLHWLHRRGWETTRRWKIVLIGQQQTWLGLNILTCFFPRVLWCWWQDEFLVNLLKETQSFDTKLIRVAGWWFQPFLVSIHLGLSDFWQHDFSNSELQTTGVAVYSLDGSAILRCVAWVGNQTMENMKTAGVFDIGRF